MAKYVKIDWDFFCDLRYYFFRDDAPADALADDIRDKLAEKMEKLQARELFSNYKQLPAGAEREKARNAYLDFVGMSSAFRSDEEVPE